MVIKLNKRIEIIKSDEPVDLPSEIQKKIEAFWEKQVQVNPHLFNGDVWSVTKCEDLPDSIRMCIQKSSYAHYLYDERVGLEGQVACYNLNCGILLETIDGYYIIGEMALTTSYPRGLQISGGNLDKNDIKPNGEVDIQSNIARELREELDIDLFDINKVSQYEFQYMEIPQGRRHSYTPMMKGILAMTVKEVESHYERYVQQLERLGEDIEFARLHFIKKSQALEILEKLDNPKRPYLEDLIRLDSQKEKVLEKSNTDLDER